MLFVVVVCIVTKHAYVVISRTCMNKSFCSLVLRVDQRNAQFSERSIPLVVIHLKFAQFGKRLNLLSYLTAEKEITLIISP